MQFDVSPFPLAGEGREAVGHERRLMLTGYSVEPALPLMKLKALSRRDVVDVARGGQRCMNSVASLD